MAGNRRTERGATLVEFAIIAPMLFLLLFGVLEFSRLIAAYTSVWTSAREWARYATTTDVSTISPTMPRYVDCAGIKQTARSRVFLADISNSDITVQFFDEAGVQVADCSGASPDSALIQSGYSVRVTVDTEFNAVVPVLSKFLSNINLHSEQERSIFRGMLGA